MAKGDILHSRILNKIIQRDEKEFLPFDKIVKSHNFLSNSLFICQSNILKLELQIGKLKDENTKLHLITLNERLITNDQKSSEDGIGHELGEGDSYLSSLHIKLLSLQEELTEMHRKKGENAQLIIDLSHSVREKDEIIGTKNKELDDKNDIIESQKKAHCALKHSFNELESTTQFLKDEQQALLLVFESLEEKYRRCQEENNELLERWLKLKSRDIDRINLENENMQIKGFRKIRKDLAEAASENIIGLPTHEDKSNSNVKLENILTPVLPTLSCSAIVPRNVLYELPHSHESEVTSLATFPSNSNGGRSFVTGGSDRKIKLWEIGKDSCDCKFEYSGCSAGVTSVQFDAEGVYLLGSSNDFATRLWTVSDQRLRHTLTGHSGKVMSAKFFDGARKVVSGSHDRTLKVWDLNSKSCIRTLFAGSSCNDVVVMDRTGSCILSGHIDKKIRLWDLRVGSGTSSSTNNTACEIPMPDKITSLDLSRDQTSLLACCRDNTLRVVDMRSNVRAKPSDYDSEESALGCYKADGFHVPFDWTRAFFSPDTRMICCGGSDGYIYIWNCLATDKKNLYLEKRIIPGSDHTNTPFLTCLWSVMGNYFIGCDSKRKTYVWI